MLTTMATQLYSPERMHSTHAADNAAQAAFAPVCFDPAEIAAGTTAKGYTVSNAQAVASFIRAPATTAFEFAGITEKAFVAGDHKRILHGGSCRALVTNQSTVAIALAVGDHLYLKPGASALEPHLQSIDGATAHVVVNSGMNPRAFVRKAVASIAAAATATVEVFLYPAWQPPRLDIMRHQVIGAQADLGPFPIGVSTGYGQIVRAGAVLTSGAAGDDNLTVDVLIGTVSIFSSLPTIDHDGVDPPQTLWGGTLGAPASGTTLGNDGAYGTMKAIASRQLTPDSVVNATLVDVGDAFAGTNCLIQAECLMY
jgi:hypothetical protein